jgi:hypothetical protein
VGIEPTHKGFADSAKAVNNPNAINTHELTWAAASAFCPPLLMTLLLGAFFVLVRTVSLSEEFPINQHERLTLPAARPPRNPNRAYSEVPAPGSGTVNRKSHEVSRYNQRCVLNQLVGN